MKGFEPGFSGARSDHSTNCVATIAHVFQIFFARRENFYAENIILAFIQIKILP